MLIITDEGIVCHLFGLSYQGHVPTMKFDYGETYGNQTAKYFQDYRSKTLNSSKSNYCKGGYFPSFYSYEPNLAVEARTRRWSSWVDPPTTRLYNQDHDGQEQLFNFRQVHYFCSLCY